jgi:hypothetical protein
MKGLKIFGIILAVLVVVVILAGGYLGFVPGVSNLFGSNKPRDLGVTYTQADYQSARAKTRSIITDLPSDAAPQQSIKYSGSHPVTATFTQAEFNALMNNRPWKYYPLKDCQLKVNPDGTAEFSAVVLTDRLKGYALSTGASSESMKVLDDYLSKVPGDPIVYTKGKASIVNGQIVNSDINELQIGRISIPADQLQNNKNSIINAAQQQMQAIPGFSVKTFKLINGQIQFEGTLPDSVARSKTP